MAAQPVREALEQERPLAAARRGEEPGEGLADGDDVVAVDGLALQAVRRDDVADALDDRVRRARRELGEAVVLADEDRRQPPERRQVDGLDEDAALDRAVAEEDDRDPRRRPSSRAREGAAERERDVAADDAGRAEQAVLDVDEVHRAAEPAAEAAVAAHQLGHHPARAARPSRSRARARGGSL